MTTSKPSLETVIFHVPQGIFEKSANPMVWVERLPTAVVAELTLTSASKMVLSCESLTMPRNSPGLQVCAESGAARISARTAKNQAACRTREVRQGARLLCGDGTEGADRAAARTDDG